MFNIEEFVKENIPLCVCTLGLAVLGYLGYHVIRWVIIRCQRTEKIDQLAQKNISNNNNTNPISSKPSFDSARPLENRVNNLEKIQDKVTVGQGEYLVFLKGQQGKTTPIT